MQFTRTYSGNANSVPLQKSDPEVLSLGPVLKHGGHPGRPHPAQVLEAGVPRDQAVGELGL